jgi:hypothetical protein
MRICKHCGIEFAGSVSEFACKIMKTRYAKPFESV